MVIPLFLNLKVHLLAIGDEVDVNEFVKVLLFLGLKLLFEFLDELELFFL
jgi:hypothetical protein